MSEERDSVAYLAGLACKMPWEDKAPLSARLLFERAVTPELFCEMLAALRDVTARLYSAVGDSDGFALEAVLKAKDAIAKAEGLEA